MTTMIDVAGWAYDAGIRDPGQLATAVAVSAAEDPGGDPAKLGDRTLQTAKWGPSVGLWQIRSLKAEKGKGTTRDQDRLTDPAFNAKAMYEISGGGKSFDAWSVTHPKDLAGYARYVAARPGAISAATAAMTGKGAAQAADGVTQLAGVVSDAAQTPIRVINWLTEGKTWVRIAWFGIGLSLVIGGGLAIGEKPIMGTAVKVGKAILPTGKIAKATKLAKAGA